MADVLPRVAGKLTANAPLAPLVWFKSGGAAEYLFEPRDVADLQGFLRDLDPAVPVMALGLGSNLIVRDGGVAGVVVRLGKAFGGVAPLNPFAPGEVAVARAADGGDAVPANIKFDSDPSILSLSKDRPSASQRQEKKNDPSTSSGWTELGQKALTLSCGGGASGILVSSTARDCGIAGLEFLRSIPGTVGGFVRMNGGAYGAEVRDRLVDCDVVLRTGELVTLAAPDLHYSYRHSALPDGAIVVAARFHGHAGEPADIQAEMDRIAEAREASQPLRSKTGGSTFKNPPPELSGAYKAWELVDRAGCRGLVLGGAQVSEKHTNFLINTGSATSSEIEALGEEVRRRVLATSGVELEWEIQRVGDA